MLMMLLAIMWVLCGVMAYGITLASLHDIVGKTDGGNRAIALCFALSGPLGLACALFYSDLAEHGVRWW